MFASCKTCDGNCCEFVDFGYVALYHFLDIDWIQYPPPYQTILSFYEGLRIPLNSVSEIVEWLFFFGFEERYDDEEYFRCIYHDEETAQCNYYKNRPMFCRGYDCYDADSYRFMKRYKRRHWKS